MNARKAITILVILIALILAGTVAVLTTVVQYFGVDSRDVITEPEMRLYERLADAARREHAPADKDQKVVGGGAVPDTPVEAAPVNLEVEPAADLVVARDEPSGDESVKELLNRLDERGWFGNSTASEAELVQSDAADRTPLVPKIIHATWKTDTVPTREFKLWSDAASRAFIAEHYPWFLTTFDGYTYPIQRADVIRYFVLHHYGGVYMDLDIGCRRNLDPLLYFEVVLPATIPVGVSNDLMFSQRGHPFMDLVIHNLITFDHTYGTNYPTVMFSTGPMFLSAVYGMWPKELDEGVERQVRILPRKWYGKNAPLSEMETSYFDHFYGSSWHADDAGFITFLGKFGMALMYIGLGIVVLGVVRLVWNKRPAALKTPRTIGPIALPYEALPFARPGTPGSRPASPLGGSRGAAPAGRYRDDGKPSGLFYMPVWLYPSSSSDRGTPGPREGTDAQGQQNWSQYFSNLSFVGDEHTGAAHHYSPVPNFSRPPSPSNNSILHAPGATHDGAFDGTPLHSIHKPKATRPPAASSSAPQHPYPSPSSPPPPSSPNPPAYTSLRSWGTSLFRGGNNPFPLLGGSTSPRAPLLPLQREPLSSDDDEARRVHLGLGRGGPSPGPAPPPGYAAAVAVGAGGPNAAGAVVDARGGPAGAGLGLGRGAGGARSPALAAPRAPAAAAPPQAGDGAVEPSPSAGIAGAGGPAGGDALEDELDRELAGLEGGAGGRRSTSPGEVGQGGVALEEEVDRLLSEMAPEDYKRE
ncbi:hypothetical protein JCM10450v2_000375 [Rhodotorula kratochvilovae]